MKTLIKFEVHSYDENDDTFKLTQSYDSPDENHDYDVDDFSLPSLVVASLVGEYGEPDEFIGKVIDFPAPDQGHKCEVEEEESIGFNSNHEFSLPLVFPKWGYIDPVFDYDFLSCYVEHRSFREWLRENGQKLLDAADLNTKEHQEITL